MSEQRQEAPEENGPVGLFPSWKWLYVTVVVYGAVVILVLYLLTVLLDFGSGGPS